MRFTTAEIATVVGGVVVGDETAVVDGATQDSRAVRPGQLFVPLVAGRDGHDFVGGAVERGASAYLTSRSGPDGPDGLGATAIRVEDTFAAMVSLAGAARDRLDRRAGSEGGEGGEGAVVGVTGSVGKTTVKDLTRGVLAADGAVHASERSFNNEIGVPLTLLGVPDGTSRVVVEMGARGLGHVAELCRIARPTIGVVTRVAMAHGELFGSIDDIARGKGELVESLPADGVAVLNADDERVVAMAARTTARVLTFGEGSADVRLVRVDVAEDLRLRIELATPWGPIEVEPAARGGHNAANAAAAAAVGLAAGVRPAEVAAGLAAAVMSPLRMAIAETPGGATILDDTYNANPTSMLAALDALARMPATRRVAVLGLMAELGVGSDDEHEAVAVEAASRGIEVLAVGAPQYRAEAHGGRSVDDIDAAVEALGPLAAGTAVLAKGSRVAGLDRLVAALVGPGREGVRAGP